MPILAATESVTDASRTRFEVVSSAALYMGTERPGPPRTAPKTRFSIQAPPGRGALGRAPRTYTAVRNASLC